MGPRTLRKSSARPVFVGDPFAVGGTGMTVPIVQPRPESMPTVDSGEGPSAISAASRKSGYWVELIMKKP